MKNILVRPLVFIFAVFLASYFVTGVSFNGWLALVIAGVLLSFVHFIIKPIVKIITLPINLITFGLFALVINALFFWFVANLIPGFDVSSFVAAFWGALVIAVVNGIIDVFID